MRLRIGATGSRLRATGRALPRIGAALGFLLVASGASLAQTPARTPAGATAYFPKRGEWETRAPEAVGMDKARLDEAVAFALANENPATRDLALDLMLTFGGREPFDALVGPTAPRGSINGIVVRRGYVVAEFGDTSRVDMTFSVTKTFLSTVVGLAVERGLIRDVDDRVRDYVPGEGLFDGEHNQSITWDHLLRQTSDWQGTLWGKPDWADRPEGERPSDWPNRKLSAPGTRYKYNDVRVNLLALCALHVFRRPLPEILRESIMEPIGASSTWRWHGYDNSWVEIDGRRIQSVSGGGHWGGGMFISARDLARFGYLFLRNGKWHERHLVSERWIAQARKPGTANAEYGYMNWFLNTGRKPVPSVPESSVTFRGNGQNIVYVDWENDLVVVVRWITSGDALDAFLGKVLASLRPETATR
jgi:CubicO group peptidase (beta-lactamase class C family)